VIVGMERLATLEARPEPLEIDLDRTAVICVDMQNAFVREGGMFDLAGWPTAGARATIEPARRVVEAARAGGVRIVYVTMSYDPDLANAGGPDTPNYHKEIGMVLLRRRPDLADKAIIHGTWGERIVEELAPLPGEPIVRKQRYSGFAGTDLDLVLKTSRTKYCAFIGGATNICVNATLMDAFSLDYWPILVCDAVYSQCPPVTVEAACWNVENIFGWVTDTAAVIRAFGA
jgi:ureidoacrylate peracid hydrolase